MTRVEVVKRAATQYTPDHQHLLSSANLIRAPVDPVLDTAVFFEDFTEALCYLT